MNERLTQLREKMKEALMKQQYTKVAKYQQQINLELHRKENVPLSTILPQMSPPQVEESLKKMHKVFVTADLLYGFALEFEANIKKYDPSMDTHVVRKVKEIAKISREITRNVDQLQCDELSGTFGEMCDEASMVLENIIYKYRQREINRRNKELKKQGL